MPRSETWGIWRFLLTVLLVAVAGCQSGPQPLPEVGEKGAWGPMPGKGIPRPDDMKYRYGLLEYFWRVTDRSGDQYNCLGYAHCSVIYRHVDPPDGWPMTMAKSDRIFLGLGWTIAADCKPKKGFRKVVAYCTPGSNGKVDADDEAVHFAKQYRDDWWEGKMGCKAEGGEEPPRILYPGVGSINYQDGKPCRCYEMSLRRLIAYYKEKVFPSIDAWKKTGSKQPFIDVAEKEAKERVKELMDAMQTEGPGD